MNSTELLLTTDKQVVFYDTETCGLYGMPTLLQYAVGEHGDIVLYEIWKRPVSETLELIEAMMKHVVVGFNLAFDHFQIQKLHSVWSLLDPEWIPEDHIDEIAEVEMDARDGNCLKPFSALDLMLYSRKGPYQSLMARKDIRIKRVPLAPVRHNDHMIPMAYAVASYLEEHVDLDPIYFARTADRDAPRWGVIDRVSNTGKTDRNFADVILRFNPSGGLKALAEHVLKMPPKFHHADICISPDMRPVELGYAPFAKAISSADKNWENRVINNDGEEVVKGYAWPGRIAAHIHHWNTDPQAREYAHDDIVYTRGLYYHWDKPDAGDKDSLLTCMVASVRWHGFSIDEDGIRDLKAKAEETAGKTPINTNKPPEIRKYINECCDDTESVFLSDTTKRSKLEEMSQWMISEDEDCLKCLGLEDDCPRCDGGIVKKGMHPASARAAEVLGIKVAKKEIELYNKLLLAGRFHASFKVTGTLSNRMAGGDGLNAQGINHDSNVRRQFPLTWDDYTLCGGDFDAFEVTIADAVYNDPDLRTAIVTGQKLHGLFGTLLFPGHTYEQILDSDHNEHDYEFGNMYGKAKAGVFAMIYGGNASTLNRNLGIPEKIAEQAFDQWGQMFPGIGDSRQRVIDAHQPLLQPNGIGTQIEWVEPSQYVESFLGFRRYFELEYSIAESLFEMAAGLPKEWQACEAIVTRSEQRGKQKAHGALSSALYGAAFGICEATVRAAANHEIQSPGAEITKYTQVAIWEHQPIGVHEWIVAPMNVHDEIICVTHPDYVELVSETVGRTVEGFRKQVPLVGMTWCKDMANWAEKKGGMENVNHITYDKDKIVSEMEATTD